MHSLLKRQLKRKLKQTEGHSQNLASFIEVVDLAYYQFDDDRLMLERSLDLSSAELIQANSELRVVFKTLPDLFLRIKYNGQILDSNGGNESDYLIKPRALIGKKLADIPVPEMAITFQTQLKEFLETKQSNRLDYAVESKLDMQHFESQLVPLTEDQVLIIVKNVTERINNEKALHQSEKALVHSEKMQAIGRLAGGIAHDFNNLLWIIKGSCQLGKRKIRKNRPVDGILEEVLTASKRAQDLVSKILTFSRLEEQELEIIEIQNITKEVLRLSAASVPSNIKIEYTLQEDCNPVYADPTEIHQVIMNLCSNAFHAMSEEGGTLKVQLHEIELNHEELDAHNLPKGHYALTTFTDEGYGMSPEIKERIFEPFFTTKQVGEGTGLGLATIHGIIDRLNGNISVESTEGKGSTFSILIPTTSRMFEEEPSNSPFQKGVHICIVGKDETICQKYSKLLSKMEYKVSTFKDGEQTLEWYEKADDVFDILITEQILSGMSGLDLLRTLKQQQEDLPCIILSEYMKDVPVQEAAELLINKTLTFPINFGELEKLIRKSLEPA